MHEVEKPKRQPKTVPYSFILLVMFTCAVMTFGLYMYFNYQTSDVSILNGFVSDESVTESLLELIPLGTSRADVETFIAENLVPSQNCYQDLGTSNICRTSYGRIGFCQYVRWSFIFVFEDETLSSINVRHGRECYS